MFLVNAHVSGVIFGIVLPSYWGGEESRMPVVGGLLRGNKNVLKLTVVGVTQLCRYIHLIVHFKSVSCIVYKWHLKAVMLKKYHTHLFL